MAQLISVKLSRFDGSPWGFRLQGGKDFGTPLIVQKVNNGSPAEAAGLRAGDAVIKVNSTEMFNLRHKDAQDVIVRAGNNFEMTIQRGGNTWRPSISPVTPSIPSPQPALSASSISPVTKTSLAANKKHDGPLIGSGHNFTAKPYPNGTSDSSTIKSIVNKQYNSPVGIYSEQTIAETLSAQAEVLAGGVLGVNFKKNEKNYNAENSQVFKMVQEADKEPKTPEPTEPAVHCGVVTSSSPALSGLKSVSAPETKPPSTSPQSSLPPGQNICAECERLIVLNCVLEGYAINERSNHLKSPSFPGNDFYQSQSLKHYGATYCNSIQDHSDWIVNNQLQGSHQSSKSTCISGNQNNEITCHKCDHVIVGVFVRIKEKNLHVECFKCSTCGTSLKNVGYYNINNKLYCDIHAKLVARQQASNSGYIPVTVPPSGKAPASTISSALGNLQSHSPISPPPPTNGTSIPPPFSKRNSFHSSSNNDYGNTTDEYDSVNINELSSHANGNMLRNNINDNRNNYNERMYTSTITIRTRNEVEAHPTNISGPKPFGGINNTVSTPHSAPISNSIGSNFGRPPSQTVTESHHLECNFSEEVDIVETQSSVGENSRPPSSVKSKSLQWPPVKNIEDITYPTASPIWIDPNPVLDRLPKHNVPDKRKEIQEVIKKKSEIINQRKEEFKKEIFSHCYQEEQEQETQAMDQSCNAPFYRKTETLETQRQYRRSSVSRPDSAEGVRRSLTPTRINQPIPKPWTGSSSIDGTYGHVQAPVPPEPPVCRKVCTCQIICERTSGPAGPEHEQEHTYHEVKCELCNPPPPTPPPPQVCEESYEMQQVEAEEIVEQETDNEVIDLSKVVPEDVAVCPKGVENQHNMYTETMEKDEGNLHIKKTTVYEKTVEILSPNRAGSPVTDTRTSSAMDGEVEHLSNRKEYVDSAEFISSRIETNRMIEEAKQENCKRQEMYEEECRREQERIRREKEAEEQREANRLRLIQAEKEEKERRIAEQRRQTDLRCRQEEQERCNSQASYSTNERNYGQSQQASEERYYKKEMKIQNNVEEVDQECRKSLRQQVEVHKCLREQQAPEKRQPTLQERRLANRFRPQSPPRQETASCQRKHVQFVTDTTEGARPLQTAPVKNSTPKEWKSEMVNALTTAPERSYSPFQMSSNMSGQQEIHEQYGSTKQMYSSQVRYEETCSSYPQPADYPRPDSPFTSALTIAPDRPYTPLGDENDRKYGNVMCVDRSDTPVNQTTPQGYCHPAEILYTDTKTRESRSRERKLTKIQGPQPLPPPPTDYKFRESSASPARSLSRCDTPRDRSLGRTTPLKKPDTIPFYQKNLVAMEHEPVESHPYVPSRSPTPCRSKSPAVKQEQSCNTYCPYSSSSSYSAYPEQKQTRSYCMEEQTPQKSHSMNYVETKSYKSDNYSENDYKRQMYSAQYEKIEKNQAVQPYQGNNEPVMDNSCEIAKVSHTPPSLQCPVASSQSAISERIQRTGVRVLPTPETTINSSSQVCESRRICHEERSINTSNNNYYSESTCSNSGVTVLPCRAISDSGSRAGIVIVPCEGENYCPQGGVRVTPTPDRGLCVSPVVHGKSSSKCSGQGGARSGGCEIDIGNCPASGVKVATCKDGSVCVAPCKLPCNQSKPQPCPPPKPLPFPHIPLPGQEDKSSCDSCPMKKQQCITESMTESSCSFKPINGQPQTNLSNQLTRLTLKRDKHVVQLFKPQAQSSQCSDGLHCGESDFRNSASAAVNNQPNNYIPKLIDKPRNSDPPNLSSYPDLGSGIGPAGDKSGKFAGSSAPKRGRGILNQAIAAGGRQPLCGHCHSYVRGPFITALGQIWCPEHFVCVNPQCRKSLHDIGFVEEKGQLYCEYCFERFIAPPCNKCNNKIKGDCLNAIGKHFHPECFSCAYCGKLFGNSPFFLEDGLPYCEADWNELFTTKCFACGFPVEAGDRWVEALNNNYHSQCFNCTMCKKNLEGQSFYAKGGRPFCKNHAR
ncbi:uncharacterized protein Zasp52 [Chelonus insularis]|uniref:uncharacterized protein Zasp52 n=1 Tax=Chelonus insularis TaxID=460826 RepID=UPI00158B259A|nr:uncharacterized protein LOC118073981 [Chelonus insularis]